jgi:type IV pilus assembly protein PilC
MDAFIVTLLVSAALAFWLNAICAFLILIGHRPITLGVIASVLFTFVLLVGLVFGLGFGLSMALLLFVMLVAGWFLYAYRRYRQARQDELLHVMATAAESGLPMAPAVAAYVHDRPREGKKWWDGILVFVFPPGYVLWVQRQVFDDRVMRLAGLLAAGAPLADALRIVPGVAPREVRVAADVGDTTGRLATCLRRADRDRLAGVWLEVMPRVIYPMMLLLFVSGVTSFLMIAIVPKLKRIFDDFGDKLPDSTANLVAASMAVGDFSHMIALVILATMVLVVILIVSPTIRWHFPIIGKLYRWEAQGLVLRMLGTLIEVGRPAPEAIAILADAPDVPDSIIPGLDKAELIVRRGEPLATALYGGGLLPASMTPLVRSAERLRALPFTLAEIGDVLSGRAVRIARRASLLVGPLLVVGVGLVVGFIVIAMFVPLIQLMSRLTT